MTVPLSCPGFFAVAASLFGLGLVLATPPLGSPDETIHLGRAFAISEGRLGVPGLAPAARTEIPASLVSLRRRLAHARPMAPPRRYTGRQIRDLFEQALAPEQRVRARFLGVYPPVAYGPQAIALLPGRLLEVSPAALVYLGRVGNLLFYVAVGWLALSLAPLRRWALCLLLLMPMSLAQAASLSADAPTHALGVLLVASIWRAAFRGEGRLARADLLGIGSTALLLGLAKPGYGVLAGAMLLVPAQRFRSRPQRALACGGVLLAALLPSVLWLLAASGAEPALPLPRADPRAQLLFVLGHPLRFLAAVGATAWEGFATYGRQLVGVFGSLNVALPGPLYAIYPLAVLAAALAERADPPALVAVRRAASLALFAAGAVCVFGLAYLGWTAVGAERVLWVQGRYFAPLLPLLLLVPSARGRSLRPELLPWASAAVACAALVAALHALRRAFWVA